MRKRCNKCHERKLVTEFHQNAKQKDGLQVWCKSCVRSYQNEKRQANRQDYLRYQREWFARHPGYFKGYERKHTKPAPGVRFHWQED